MTDVTQYCDVSRDILLRSVANARELAMLLLIVCAVCTIPDHIPHANLNKSLGYFGNNARKVNTGPHYWYIF
jgi:hypothetical protein